LPAGPGRRGGPQGGRRPGGLTVLKQRALIVTCAGVPCLLGLPQPFRPGPDCLESQPSSRLNARQMRTVLHTALKVRAGCHFVRKPASA
jgi:hypothetical protein